MDSRTASVRVDISWTKDEDGKFQVRAKFGNTELVSVLSADIQVATQDVMTRLTTWAARSF